MAKSAGRGGKGAYAKEQLLYALEDLASPDRTPERERKALEVLTGDSRESLRAAFHRHYRHHQALPRRRDPGAHVRAAILRALRPAAGPDDVPLLEEALFTYELPPTEGLRGAALVALSEVDPLRAAYHAARLLGDEHTSRMSGEPAVTAARVLASQGQTLPLYAQVLDPAGAPSEVISECLRNLTGLPASLLPTLVSRYIESRDEFVLVGLFDLIAGHQSAPEYADTLADFLRDTRLHDAYRYLVTMIVASRHPALLPVVLAAARRERDPLKVKALQEALSLIAGDPTLM